MSAVSTPLTRTAAQTESGNRQASAGHETSPRYKVLAVATHPVQYAAPLFRLMAVHPKLDLLVAYCSLLGSEPMMDSGFGVEVTWDVPLLEGYPWTLMRNRSKHARLESFFGLTN